MSPESENHRDESSGDRGGPGALPQEPAAVFGVVVTPELVKNEPEHGRVAGYERTREFGLEAVHDLQWIEHQPGNRCARR